MTLNQFKLMETMSDDLTAANWFCNGRLLFLVIICTSARKCLIPESTLTRNGSGLIRDKIKSNFSR